MMKYNARGFSLVELLIAMAIAATLAAAMAAIFATTVKTREQVDKDGQRIEAGRYALDVLSDDIKMAGYYGGYMPRAATGTAWPSSDTATTPLLAWSTPGPCETTLANLGWSPTGTANVPVHIAGYEAHGTAITTVPSCLSNYVANTDILVVRRTSTVSYAPDSASVTTGDVYLQSSDCSSDTQGFILSNAPTDFTLRKLSCASGSTGVSQIRKYMVRVYYIASCNVCSGTDTDTIPTLKVAELTYSGGSLVMTINSVASGIEDMHIEYGVDTYTVSSTESPLVPNGSPDSFELSNNTAAPAFAWQNVVSVKAYLLARDTDKTQNYTNNLSYVLGQKTITKSDNYKRAVFSSTIRLVNPSGARES